MGVAALFGGLGSPGTSVGHGPVEAEEGFACFNGGEGAFQAVTQQPLQNTAEQRGHRHLAA